MARWLISLTATLALAAPALGQDSSRAGHEANRDNWQKVETIFEAMAVKPGSVVADVGAGGGYFTSRLSRAEGPSSRASAPQVSDGRTTRPAGAARQAAWAPEWS